MLHVREGWLQRIDIEPDTSVAGEEFGFGGSEIAVAGEYAPVYELAAADIVYIDNTGERWQGELFAFREQGIFGRASCKS